MKRLDIFTLGHCCATRDHPSSVDVTLAQFDADVAWLTEQNVQVERYHLKQDPRPFALNPIVARAMATIDGPEKFSHILPIVLVDGAEFCVGRYPSRNELSEAFGRKLPVPSTDLESAPTGGGCCSGGCHA